MPIYVGNTEINVEDIGEVWIGNTKISGGGEPPVPPQPPYPITDMLCFEAKQSNSTIYFCFPSSKTNCSIRYSTDAGTSWYEFSRDTSVSQQVTPTITLANVGDKVYFGGLFPQGFGGQYPWDRGGFFLTGNWKLSGNIHKLINYQYSTTMSYPTSVNNNYEFEYLFYQQSALTDVSGLVIPYTTCKSGCYSNMFYSCGITAPPQLTITSLASSCCMSMFCNCTSLLTPLNTSSLTSTASGCFSNMYSGCTSLTTTNNAIMGITSIVSNACYSMFEGCTSLTEPSKMTNVTEIEQQGCQYMYRGCTSLNKLPRINARIYGYDSLYRMLYNCSSIYVYAFSGTGHTIQWGIPQSLNATSTYDEYAMAVPVIEDEWENVGWAYYNTRYYTSNSIVS